MTTSSSRIWKIYFLNLLNVFKNKGRERTHSRKDDYFASLRKQSSEPIIETSFSPMRNAVKNISFRRSCSRRITHRNSIVRYCACSNLDVRCFAVCIGEMNRVLRTPRRDVEESLVPNPLTYTLINRYIERISMYPSEQKYTMPEMRTNLDLLSK